MASISVRKLDDVVYEQLRIRAATHGIPMEEEVRRILSQAVKLPTRLSAVFGQYFGKKNGVDLELPVRKPHEPMDFNE